MASITLTVTQATLEKMYLHYQNNITKVPAHTMFQAKTANCTITAYLSKKIAFQGQHPELEAKKWGTVEIAKSSIVTPGLHLKTAVGADEVGTGDYLGPIVVCCAYVREDQVQTLLDMGIRDSKQLTDDIIGVMAAKIKQIIPYHCIILPNDKYNLMTDKGMNANSIKAFLHNKALLSLQEKIGQMPEIVILDEFVNQRKYYEYLSELPSKPAVFSNLTFIQKAEGVHVSVAAASIIARASFVDYMAAVESQVGMRLPKGAGSGVDSAARAIYRQKGADTLKRISKWHFSNTKRVTSR